MRLPILEGVIRRRVLVNYRVDPELLARQLPPPFRPKLHNGAAVGGICLIRLEQIHPAFVPLRIGFASENAAHRIAVLWRDDRQPHRLHGIRLETQGWHVEPLHVDEVASSYFDDTARFPTGTALFDCALIMRNIRHRWHAADDLYALPTCAA